MSGTASTNTTSTAAGPKIDPSGQTLRELYEGLRRELDGDTDEYFSSMWTYDHATPARELEQRGFPVLTDDTRLADVRYRWLAVFPATGGSEGHYVHVDLIWQREYRDGRVPLLLFKTFQGLEHAITVAGKLARLLEV